MYNKTLSYYVNKLPWLQYIVGFMPFVMVLIFSAIYMADLMSFCGVVTINNKVVEESIKEGSILSIDESSDLSQIRHNVSFFCKPDIDGYLYSVYFIDKDLYMLRWEEYETVSDNKSTDWFVNKTAFVISDNRVIESVYTNEGVALMLVDGHELEFRIHVDMPFYKVRKSENGYELRYSDGYTVSVNNATDIIGLKDIGNNTYTFYQSNILVPEDIYPCSVLPDNGLYYDFLGNSLVKNMDTLAFCKNLIIASKMPIVLLFDVVFIILLVLCYKKKVLDILGGTKGFIYFNLLGILLLAVMVTYTYFFTNWITT